MSRYWWWVLSIENHCIRWKSFLVGRDWVCVSWWSLLHLSRDTFYHSFRNICRTLVQKEAVRPPHGLGRLWFGFCPSGVCICGFAGTPLPDHLAGPIFMHGDHMCISSGRVPSDVAWDRRSLFLRLSALVGTGDHEGKRCLDAIMVTLGKHELFANIHLFTGQKKKRKEGKKPTTIILELFWAGGFYGWCFPRLFTF